MENAVRSFFQNPVQQETVLSILRSYEEDHEDMAKTSGEEPQQQEVWRGVLYDLVCDIITARDYGQPLSIVLKKEQSRPGFMFRHPVYDKTRKALEEEARFVNNPIEVEDGIIECSKCGSSKTISYSKQTRASDEGTSVFVTCVRCKHRFRL